MGNSLYPTNDLVQNCMSSKVLIMTSINIFKPVTDLRSLLDDFIHYCKSNNTMDSRTVCHCEYESATYYCFETYNELIAYAITSSPEKKMKKRQIYKWMILNVPKFTDLYMNKKMNTETKENYWSYWKGRVKKSLYESKLFVMDFTGYWFFKPYDIIEIPIPIEIEEIKFKTELEMLNVMITTSEINVHFPQLKNLQILEKIQCLTYYIHFLEKVLYFTNRLLI